MGRGLSTLQKHILTILQTKCAKNSNTPFFTTDEIISEMSFDYMLWLKGLPPYQNLFGYKPRSAKRQKCFEPLRIAVYRSLQSLEKRGLVVSYFLRHSRWWAVPSRVKDEIKWVETDKRFRKYRRLCWQRGARKRKLKKPMFRYGT
jgi:hypothetical protein